MSICSSFGWKGHWNQLMPINSGELQIYDEVWTVVRDRQLNRDRQGTEQESDGAGHMGFVGLRVQVMLNKR